MSSLIDEIPEIVPISVLVDRNKSDDINRSIIIFPFSASPLMFNIALDDLHRLAAMRYLIVAPLYNNGELFPVGVIGSINFRDVRRPSTDMLFRGICRVRYVLDKEKEKNDPVFSYAKWMPLPDVPVAEEIARRAGFREKIELLKRLFNKFLIDNLRSFDETKRKEILDIPKVTDTIIAFMHLSADNLAELGGVLDGIVSVVNIFEKMPDASLILLQETDVNRRLDLVIQLLSALHRGELIGKEEGMRSFANMPNQPNSPYKSYDEKYRKIRDRLPKEARKKIESELKVLYSLNPDSLDAQKIVPWLDLILDLPWGIYDESVGSAEDVRRVLDEDHYDLNSVKEKIVDYIVAHTRNPKKQSPKLAFIGPPGTGKTSLGKSIARALGRKFVRISVGGIRDESEIRGHRRTYVGALPGAIIDGIHKAGSMNPIFMIDEIDKLERGAGLHGDPEAAMLEVLDPEQNYAFMDHYLNVPMDLSHVIFICTGNLEERILRPLADRLDIIRLPGYTAREKLHIARNHLLPRRLAENRMREEELAADGLPRLEVEDDALMRIIESQREAGVRNLERELDKLFVRILRHMRPAPTGAEREILRITAQNIREYLREIRKPKNESYLFNLRPGAAVGLAVSEYGGTLMVIEATKRRHNQWEIHFTHKPDDIVKDSAKDALDRLIHERGILEGAVGRPYWISIGSGEPGITKSGPSAGITFYVVLYSLLTNTPVKAGLAMTGAITKTLDNVGKVGGVRDKVLAAINHEFREVIIPYDNADDIEEIPEEDRSKIMIHMIRTPEEALAIAFPNDENIKSFIVSRRRP